MITLYHCQNARSFRVLWALEELGLAYNLQMLPFPPRIFQRDYLAINPLGTIPFFIDGETRMTESAAICQFLASRYGGGRLAVAPEDAAYGAYLNFLSFGEATLTFPQALVLRYRALEATRSLGAVADDYERWFAGRLRGIEPVLSEQPYLCAGRFTAADISVGYALKLAEILSLSGYFAAPVKAYWERLSLRQGYQRACAAQARAAGDKPPEIG
jgi:glutathione S-transferase